MVTEAQAEVDRQPGGRIFSLTVFICFLALYAATAQRGLSWQDSGEFQYRILVGDYFWHSGIARAHPLYIAAARFFMFLFPVSQRIYAINLFSGVGLALALVFLTQSVWRVTGKIWCAAVSAVLLGLAHMPWWLATVAEVYTWSLAFLMAELYVLSRFFERRERRWLLLLFLLNGAHFSVHNFALLALPVYGSVLVAELCRMVMGRQEFGVRRWLQAGALAICVMLVWSAGAVLLWWQALAACSVSGCWRSTLASLLFGDGYRQAVVGFRVPAGGRLALANLALAGVSLANPCWLFALRGWRGLSDNRALRWCLLWLTALHLAFWCRYFVPDQATFALPSLGLLAVWAGLGARAHARPRYSWLAAGVACAAMVPLLLYCGARGRADGLAGRRELPFRDEARYWLVPWKMTERSAHEFAVAVASGLTAQSVVVADATSAGPLLTARETGLIKGEWRIVTPWSGESESELEELVLAGGRKIYVVSPLGGYVPAAIKKSADGFVREGVLYRVQVRER